MEASIRRGAWLRRLAVLFGVLAAVLVVGLFVVSRADGPVGIFAGGPFRSGEPVDFAAMNWDALDELHELEMEIVGEESSLTLWFSVSEGVAYIGCDLDCVGGRLTRWPQQIELDPRVVVRIAGRRVEGELIHVPHGSAEYDRGRADRERKYSGEGGSDEAAATAAHSTVVSVGEVLTGRDQRSEPGDRLYRLGPRQSDGGPSASRD